MLTEKSLKDALRIVEHFKNEYSKNFMTAPEDKLIAVRNGIETLTKLENRLKNEIKGNSDFIKELNKEI